jgi:integrase
MMKFPEPYRACSCRVPGTDRLLGKSCPGLKRSGHGGWYARYEAPRSADQRRRRPRIGPYPTKKACMEALLEVLGRIGQGAHVDDRRTTFGQYLTRRLSWWESEADLKPSTLASYREAIELYFKPGLGHLRLVDLRDHHFRDLAAAMRKINTPAADRGPSDLLRRLLDARATRDGKRISTRPLTDARIRRVLAVASSALGSLVPHTLPFNPAANVKAGKGRRRKPLLWTAARVERWRETGEIPAPVMVWSREHCGAFLDSIDGERLYALFELAAYTGLRRSELAGLCWPDVDLASRRIHIRLPPITLHGLRHGAATMLLAAGQQPKVVSEILGHSTVAFTMDVYTEVAEELAEAAADALAAYVPRAPRTPADKTL